MSAKVMTFVDELEARRFRRLASSIKKRAILVSLEKERLDTDKDKLKKYSVEQFYADLAGVTPVVVTNHEYHGTHGIVTVNFKVSQSPKREYNGQPADRQLKELAGDSYAALFTEITSPEVRVEQSVLIEQAQEKPELFALLLKDELTAEQRKTVLNAHPEMFEVLVPDTTRYADTYPDCVTHPVDVVPQPNFLDKVSALPQAVKAKMKEFLRMFLSSALMPAVLTKDSAKSIKK